MNKLVLICLLFVIPAAIAQDCNNPLLTKLGITKITAAAQTGLQFCKSLEGGNLCCSTATINTLQTTVDTMVAKMIVKAAARDVWLLSLRTDTTSGLPSFQTALSTLQTTAKAALVIVNGNSGLGSTPAPDNTNTVRLNLLKAAITPFSTISDDATTNVDTKWESYETTRATCIEALVKAQASIYCLACRQDYNTAGVDTVATADPLIILSTSSKTALSASCQPFLAQAQIQNALPLAYSYRAQLTALNTKLAAITTSTIATDTAASTVGSITPESVTDDNEEPLAFLAAADCTSTDCPFAYNTLLTQSAVLNQDYAANGGKITVSSSSRVLNDASELSAGSRTLAATGTYDPVATSAGVTVEFPDDAIAAVNSGFRQGGLMACFVALIAALLF